MSLCAIIGSGQVGEFVAAHIGNAEPDVQIIGLTATRSWLETLAPTAEFIYSFQFKRFLLLLRRFGATDVIFAGEPLKSFRLIDAMLLAYLLGRKHSLRIPHAYLEAVQDLLSDNGISLRSPLEYLPQLAAEVGLAIGNCTGYRPSRDFQAAVDHVTQQPWSKICEAYIVDEGQVLMSETKGTNHLIRKFGASSDRKSAVFPALCKVTVPPFEKIDQPTIGIDTARLCIDNGIRAIVVEGGKTILMQRQEVVRLVNSGLICVYALQKDVLPENSQSYWG